MTGTLNVPYIMYTYTKPNAVFVFSVGLRSREQGIKAYIHVPLSHMTLEDPQRILPAERSSAFAAAVPL